jgi:hypothetical protein
MPDEPLKDPQQGQDPNKSPDPAAQAAPAEPVDDRGVPLKNVVAELQRKRAEDQELLEQYKALLGQQMTQPQQAAQPQPATDDPAQFFDADTTSALRKLVQHEANQVAYQLMGRAQFTQELADPEVKKAAQEEYQNINNSPLYASLPDVAKEDMAIKAAKVRVLQGKLDAATKAGTDAQLADAARQQAGGASLPGTERGGDQHGEPQNQEEYIKQYIAETLADEKRAKIFQSFYRLDPRSKEGQEKLRRAAIEAYKGLEWGGKTGVAIQYAQGGGIL